MDNVSGSSLGEKVRQSGIKPSNLVFFIGKDLVKLLHTNRASNVCSFYNYINGKEQTMLLTDFKKHRKRAYTFSNTLRIFNRSRMQFERMISSESIPKPTGTVLNGTRTWQKRSYYSEDDLFAIRNAMAHVHVGRPRKDGKITPRKDVLTEKDLRSVLGDAIMLYTKNKDGEFIPVWAEETW
jgi:hypothetical protein